MLPRTTVRLRLIATLSACVLTAVIIGIFALKALSAANGTLRDVYRHNVVPMQAVLEMRDAILDVRGRMLLPALLTSEAETAELQQEYAGFRQTIDNDWALFRDNAVLTVEEEALVEQASAELDALEMMLDRYMEVLEIGDYRWATDLFTGDLRGYFISARDAFSQLAQARVASTRQAYAAGEQAWQQQRVIIITLLALAILMIALIGWRLVRSILKPLDQARHFALDIAEGNLQAHLEHRRRDEFGDMLDALLAMRHRLGAIVLEVRHDADGVGSASQQLAQGNDDLSRRTQAQAASLQETASSLDQVTATVRQTADNAAEADRLANEARDRASAGGRVVEQAIAAMEEINTSSREINSIVSLIDDIAFQTNLLALNASVEAARAGEQGRGFAVVAGEVRTLAGRAAEAAQEIKRKVDESASRVTRGDQLVRESGVTLGEIVTGTERATLLISEIARASREQTDGLEQANSAVARLDDITQRNAALVEQASAASYQLQQQSDTLRQRMAVFRVTATHDKDTSALLSAGGKRSTD